VSPTEWNVFFFHTYIYKKKREISVYYFRSPSPEPIYDQQGKRQNTREVRRRRKIEEQRHQFITELLTLNPDYKPPGDYRFVLII